MPRLAPTPLQLTGTEREQLEQLVNRHSTAQQVAIRASIILLADEGQNHREIARDLNISRDMTRVTKNLFKYGRLSISWLVVRHE